MEHIEVETIEFSQELYEKNVAENTFEVEYEKGENENENN